MKTDVCEIFIKIGVKKKCRKFRNLTWYKNVSQYNTREPVGLSFNLKAFGAWGQSPGGGCGKKWKKCEENFFASILMAISQTSFFIILKNILRTKQRSKQNKKCLSVLLGHFFLVYQDLQDCLWFQHHEIELVKSKYIIKILLDVIVISWRRNKYR